MGILEQLKSLFLQALPITVIVFFLYFFLRWAFWEPLERVLAARQAATEGAKKEAEEILGRAQEKLRQYEDSLRQARAEIYRQQETARGATLETRSRILKETREKAGESIRQAKLEVAREVEQAKKELEAESERLADQIARSLLSGGKRA